MIMGIINVTPDSFSRDGVLGTGEDIATKAQDMVNAGADVLDIGGESTRPGARLITLEEELARVIPAVRTIRRAVDVPISLDTSKAEVARQALAEGAAIVNDVTSLRDPEMPSLLAATGANVVIVHGRQPADHEYLMETIVADLRDKVMTVEAAGVSPERIIVDPGFGFSKTWRQNLQIVQRLRTLQVLGKPVLIGPSRKGTIQRVVGGSVDDRLEGTAALVTAAIAQGADVVRVHDVLAIGRVVRMADRLARSSVLAYSNNDLTSI